MASGRSDSVQTAAALLACKFGTSLFSSVATDTQSGSDVVASALSAQTDPADVDRVAGQFVMSYVIKLLKEGAEEQSPPLTREALGSRIDALRGTQGNPGNFERFWTRLAPPPMRGTAVPTITRDLNKLLDISASASQYRYALTGPSNTDQCDRATARSDSCYICGTPFPLARNCNAPAECEHVLPVFYAAMYLFLYTGQNRGTAEYRRGMEDLLSQGVGELEYDWAHMCCNRLKSNISPVFVDGAQGFVVNRKGWKNILKRIQIRVRAKLSQSPCGPTGAKTDVAGSCVALVEPDPGNRALSALAARRADSILDSEFVSRRRSDISDMLRSGMIPALNQLMQDLGSGAVFYAFSKIFLFGSMHGLKSVLFTPDGGDANEAGLARAKRALAAQRATETRELKKRKRDTLVDFRSAALESGVSTRLVTCVELAEGKAGLLLASGGGRQATPRAAQGKRLKLDKVETFLARWQRSDTPDEEQQRELTELGVALKACAKAAGDVSKWRETAVSGGIVTDEEASAALDLPPNADVLLARPGELYEQFQAVTGLGPSATSARSAADVAMTSPSRGGSVTAMAPSASVRPASSLLSTQTESTYPFSGLGRPAPPQKSMRPLQPIPSKEGPISAVRRKVSTTKPPAAQPADLQAVIEYKENQIIDSQRPTFLSAGLPKDADPTGIDAEQALLSRIREASDEYEASEDLSPSAIRGAYAIGGDETSLAQALAEPSGQEAMQLALSAPYASYLATLLQSQVICANEVARGMEAYNSLTSLISDKIDGLLPSGSIDEREYAVIALVNLALSHNTVLSQGVFSDQELGDIGRLIADYNQMPSIGPFPQSWASSDITIARTKTFAYLEQEPQLAGPSGGARRRTIKRKRGKRTSRRSRQPRCKTRRRKRARARGKALSRRARRRYTSR